MLYLQVSLATKVGEYENCQASCIVPELTRNFRNVQGYQVNHNPKYLMCDGKSFQIHHCALTKLQFLKTNCINQWENASKLSMFNAMFVSASRAGEYENLQASYITKCV